MESLRDRAAENLAAVRQNAPLIHNITNFVVMNVTANALLAIGASPVMAHAPEEVAEMAGNASALVLNIGTLSREWVPAMVRAGQTAGSLGKPVVFDPVGAGATRFRTETAQRLLKDAAVRLVRGNASEIRALSNGILDAAPHATQEMTSAMKPDLSTDRNAHDAWVGAPPTTAATRGVDAVHSAEEVLAAATRLSQKTGIVMAVTGPTDIVTDGRSRLTVFNGHRLMRRVTGTGCIASAVVAAFAAVDSDPAVAAATGLAVFGLAGEVAGEAAAAPGTFMVRLLDALYTLTPEQVQKGVRIERE